MEWEASLFSKFKNLKKKKTNNNNNNSNTQDQILGINLKIADLFLPSSIVINPELEKERVLNTGKLIIKLIIIIILPNMPEYYLFAAKKMLNNMSFLKYPMEIH